MTDEEIKALLRFEGLSVSTRYLRNDFGYRSWECLLIKSSEGLILNTYAPTESEALQEAWKKYNNRRNQSKT